MTLEKISKLILLSSFLLSLVFVLNPKINTNDAIGYYAQTVSLVNDGDLNLREESTYYEKMGLENNLQFDPNTEIYYSQYPIGVSLFQVPILAIIKWVSGDEFMPYALKTTRLINFFASLLGAMAMYLLWMALSKLFERKASLISLVLLLLASASYFYIFIQSSYSHVYSFFSCSLFLYFFLMPLVGSESKLDFSLAERRTWRNHFLMGLSLGVLTVTRYLDGLLVLILIIEFLFLLKSKRSSFWALLSPYLVSALVFTSILGIQLGIQYWQHASWNVLAYYDGHFSGTGILYNWPRLLFSSYHGLFYWHPILFIGLLGWLAMLKSKDTSWNLLGFMFGLILLILSFVTSAWGKFAFGASSFGHRFFISIYPFFVIGVAFFIQELLEIMDSKRKIGDGLIAVVSVFLIAWNFGLMYQMLTGMITSEGPVGWMEMAKNNFYHIPKEWLQIITK